MAESLLPETRIMLILLTFWYKESDKTKRRRKTDFKRIF